MIYEDLEPIIMEPIEEEPRGLDNMGSGAFAAPRGNRVHYGEDYVYHAGDNVYSHISGTILRIGWPYAGEDFRLIEMLDDTGQLVIRYFYVKPCVGPGAKIECNQKIGVAQDIAGYHGEGMTPHVHVECYVSPSYLYRHCR